MQLYTYDRAPNPQRLKYFLKLKNISLDNVQFDLATGEHFNREFKSINPDCTVPTLVTDNGTVLTDTIAICIYLEKLYPQTPLLGKTDLEYAQVIGWCHKVFLEGFMPVAEVLRNKSDKFKDRALPGRMPVAQVPELIVRGGALLENFWKKMDEHFQSNAFVVGDELTLADIDVFVVVGFAGWIKASINPEHQAFLQWHEKVSQLLNIQ